MTRRRTIRDIRGFTLVELLVTIAVGAILLSVAVPSFKSVIATNRLAAQANDMVAAISYARSDAVKRNGSVSFCRAASAVSTSCAGSAGNWEHWIVRTATGTVIQRGSVNTYGGAIVVDSTLTGDQVVFGSDGLARTGGALANGRRIGVCAPDETTSNIRWVVMGAGSRLSTETHSGDC